jgi:hypothetical protein
MARGINKVILIGNLGADPEIRAMPSGLTVANIRLATSENWKDKQSGESKERTEWHNVAMFGRLGEIAGEYLKKCNKVSSKAPCALASGRTSRAMIATPQRSSATRCRCLILAEAAWAAVVATGARRTILLRMTTTAVRRGAARTRAELAVRLTTTCRSDVEVVPT